MNDAFLEKRFVFVKGFINNIKKVTYRNFIKSIHEEAQGVPMHSITYTPITH